MDLLNRIYQLAGANVAGTIQAEFGGMCPYIQIDRMPGTGEAHVPRAARPDAPSNLADGEAMRLALEVLRALDGRSVSNVEHVLREAAALMKAYTRHDCTTGWFWRLEQDVPAQLARDAQ